MQKRFLELDDRCIAIARDVAPLQAAGSPQFVTVQTKLIVARRERDDTRWLWNRKKDQLAVEVEKYTRKDIAKLGADSEKWLDTIYRQRNVFAVGKKQGLDGDRRDIRTNAKSIRAAINFIIAEVAKIRAMNLRPLHEVRLAVKRLHTEVDSMLDTGFPANEEALVASSRIDDLRWYETAGQPQRLFR